MRILVNEKAKQELVGILIEINRLVTEHLNVQKNIFNPTIRSKIRIPLFFKKIEFEHLYETNKKIQSELYTTIKKIQKEKNDLEIDPFIYGGIKDYALLFHASSQKLTQIAFSLHLNDKKQKKLTHEEYSQLVNEYQIFENSRLQKGSTIQKIAGLLAN